MNTVRNLLFQNQDKQKEIEELPPLNTIEELRHSLGSDGVEIVNYMMEGNIVEYENSLKMQIKNKEVIEKLALIAVSMNSIIYLRIMLNCGINLKKSKDSLLRTPLHYAAYYGYLDCVKFLIEEAKLNSSKEDSNGYSTLEYASESGDVDIIDYILNIIDDDISETSSISFSSEAGLDSGLFVKLSAPSREPLAAQSNSPPPPPPTRSRAPMAPQSMSRSPAVAPSMAPQFIPPPPAVAQSREPMEPQFIPPPPAAPTRSRAPMAPQSMLRSPADDDVPMMQLSNAPMAPRSIRRKGPMRDISPIQDNEVEFRSKNITKTKSVLPALRMFRRNKISEREFQRKPIVEEEQRPNKNKVYVQSITIAAKKGNTNAVIRLLDNNWLVREVRSGLGSGRNSILHFLGRRISAQELEKLSQCGLDLTSRNTNGVRAFEEVPPRTLQDFLDLRVKEVRRAQTNDENEIIMVSNPFATNEYNKLDLDISTLLELSKSTIHSQLIFHPIFSGLCSIKWHKISPLFWLTVLLLLSFTSYISWYAIDRVKKSLEINFIDNNIIDIEPTDKNILICQICTTSLLFILVMMEIFNMLLHNIYVFILRFISLIINIIIVLLILIIFPVEFLKYNIFFVIFIPWITLMYQVCQHYALAQYYSNFIQITKTSLKILFAFGSLPIAFSLVFYIMRLDKNASNDSQDFDYIHTSLIKSISMMMGDFAMNDFSHLYTDLQWTFAYFIFVIGVALILYNMINALAVSDTQKLNDRAEIFRTIALARQISSAQRWLHFLSKIPIIKKFIKKPNIIEFQVICKNFKWKIVEYYDPMPHKVNITCKPKLINDLQSILGRSLQPEQLGLRK